MNQNAYIGHESQLCGVEELRLCGGKGDGMRLMQLRNGAGLELTVCADRCADIARLRYRGENLSFFSANGYVAPTYYDDKADGWLKNFTAGFLTTCGLTAVGSPCVDAGQALGLHGSIGNTPAERIGWDMDEEAITIRAVMRHAQIFSDKLLMTRTISCAKKQNTFTITDRIENVGGETSPLMILYHMNMGYPLLSETAQIYIPAQNVVPRNAHAAEDLDTWDRILSPTPGFEEQCYYHEFGTKPGLAAIFNPSVGFGLKISFDAQSLDSFTEWKMMGYKDYVLGLEPGNCTPDGRDVLRQAGKLKFIEPGQTQTYSVTVSILESADEWQALKA